MQGDLKTADGGLADNLKLENPFDPNSKPINLKFDAERPYFNLPQGGLPSLSLPGSGGGSGPGGGGSGAGGGPVGLQQQGPQLLPPGALAAPGGPAAAGGGTPATRPRLRRRLLTRARSTRPRRRRSPRLSSTATCPTAR